MTDNHTLPRLVLTMGEPGGIGPELTLALWQYKDRLETPPFVLLSDPAFMQACAKRLGIHVPIIPFDEDSGLELQFNEGLPILDIGQDVIDRPATASPQNGSAVIESIRLGVQLIKDDTADAIVTNPINKKSLYEAGFEHPGHTEYLGELAHQWDNQRHQPVMMLAGPELRTVPATLHIPLKDVPNELNTNDLVRLIEITASDLKTRFGIDRPRLVVAGLNPHAGEEGTMGTEDDTIITPAIINCQSKGIDVTGPHPADTLFYKQKRETYDAAIAMYHDQALLPVKTIAFDETVNVTLGLPFIRTSPDHGTALDIAGQNIARPDSLLAALKMAGDMVLHNKLLGH